MNKAFKFRIYPNQQQKVAFAKHFGCVRFIYNYGLNLTNTNYKSTNKHLSWVEVANKIPELKKDINTNWLKEVNSQSLQSAIKNLDSSFTRFFKKTSKFPNFKSKHNKQSFQVPQNLKIDYHNSTISLPKIKGQIKIIFSRRIPQNSKIGCSTISINKAGQYYISIQFDDGIKTPQKHKINKEKAIAIDLGIKDFAILSDGNKIKNPKFKQKVQKKIKKLQKKASRKIKGSKNRQKANVKVAKVFQKITNKKQDFLHKLSSKIVSENQTICLEDLNISGMLKNHKLAKSIQYCSWYEFTRQLEYKSEWNGVNIIYINRFSPSSKMCSECGSINNNLTLKDRNWCCESCGAQHDRDINAAKNILDFAFNERGIKIRQELPKLTPMENHTSINFVKRISKQI